MTTHPFLEQLTKAVAEATRQALMVGQTNTREAEEGIRQRYAEANQPLKEIRWYQSPAGVIHDLVSDDIHESLFKNHLRKLWESKTILASNWGIVTGRFTPMNERLTTNLMTPLLRGVPKSHLLPRPPMGKSSAAQVAALQFAETTEFGGLDKLVHLTLVAAYENVCYLVEQPRRWTFDNQNRLHNFETYAVEWGDQYGLYFWHGTLITADIAEAPLSVKAIETQRNVEIRRLLTERYGYERYIKESGLKPIQQDKTGTLYRKDMINDEPLVVVCVTNSTPEPDGTYRTYWLRVPPTMDTAHAAVAWTFNLTPETYKPAIET